jgi:FKBP-type peptidyl-prolyl cis-trans isomerase SlpA
MTSSDVPGVKPDSHLTLHYRVSLLDGGADAKSPGDTQSVIVNTFDSRPATLQLGQGQLADALESRLLGLPEASSHRFELVAGEAYGQRSPDLVQSISRALFDANVDTDSDGAFEPGDPVQINGPGGERVAGVLKAIDASAVVVDFNHPLADRAVVFEVEILGVL